MTAIAIVGGGPAGLSTAGALRKVGLSATVFDRDATIGSSWLKRYDRLHLHTIRRFSGLAHFPIPRSYPKYIPRDLYARYLQSYAEKFRINVVHNCEVQAVEAGDSTKAGTPAFSLSTTQGTVHADIVVIAAGMYGDPVVPRLAHAEGFQGAVLHSSAYSSGRRFAGKRVLVVGLGNTGAEIAIDLVEQGAAFVAVSVRASPPIVPRDFLGVPVQAFGIALSRAPIPLADAIGRVVARIAIGDLSQYGLPKAEWLPFSARRIPVIDVGFVDGVKRRKVSIRPPIAEFSRNGVKYANGRSEEFDAVIFATGYRTSLERLVRAPDLLDDAGFPHAGCGQNTPVPGLYFMGYIESHRGLLYEIEIASRRLARAIATRP